MTTQTELKRSERIAPLLASVPLMVISILYAAIMASLGWNDGDPDWRGIVAGFPWVTLWLYGALVLLVVRSHVDVDPGGVSVYYTPLPCGSKTKRYAREEIVKLTVDRIHVAKEGHYWRIGMRLADGRQILLPERHREEGVARERVAAMNSVMAAGVRPELPLGSFFESANKRNWAGARVLLLWGGAFLSAITWGLALELSRYKYY